MPSLLSRIVPLVLRVTRANRIFLSAEAAGERIAERRASPANFEPTRMRSDVGVTRAEVRGWPVFTVSPASRGAVSTGSADGARSTDGALVYLHGGAWVNEIAPQHWQLAAQIAAEAHLDVIVVIYPLVPFGTAAEVVAGTVEIVRDALAAHGDGRVSIGGDSAGGQIALSAALLLRDAGITLPQTVLISPSLDLSMKNPEMDVVQPSDPWLGKVGAQVFIDAWRAELPLEDPRVSPLEGDLAGLGPLVVFSGTRDILNPDTRLLVVKARAAGVDVTYHEEVGLVHVYPLTPTPEGRTARAAMVDVLRSAP